MTTDNNQSRRGTSDAVLRLGTLVRYDGQMTAVTALSGSRVTLRSRSGEHAVVDVGALLSDPDTTVLDRGHAPLTPPQAGLLLASLDPADLAALRDRVGHVREVLHGTRDDRLNTGRPDQDQPPPVRAEYDLSRPLGERQAAKAKEIGVSTRTIRSWCDRYRGGTADRPPGPEALVDGGRLRGSGPLTGLDPRWVDAARAEIDRVTDDSTMTLTGIRRRIEARLNREQEPGRAVPRPARTKAFEALNELGRGRGTFTGSAKTRRSIANRPVGTYGRLRANRPGEAVLLDTTILDVFAMEPVTMRWVRCELTIALDLYTRCIVGLRLTPYSTKSHDVNLVLFEAVTPRRSTEGDPQLRYHGLPEAVVVDADQLDASPRDSADPLGKPVGK